MMLSREGRHQHGLSVFATLGTREGWTVSRRAERNSDSSAGRRSDTLDPHLR